MTCNNCGANNDNNATTCSSCGAPLGGQAPMGGGNPGITERNIVTCVILSIVTLGIYAIIWMIYLHDDSSRLSNEQNAQSGGMVVLLTIVTCGIYGIYWMYKRGEIVDNYYASKGTVKPNNAVVYLLLTLFGLSIVSFALLQSELNKVSRGEI